MMDFDAYWSQFPFAQRATDEEKQLAARNAYMISFGKGEVVHTRNQADCLGCVLVVSGMLSASMISDDGKQILLYRLSPGEVCVFTADCVLNLLNYDVVVEGESAGTALVLPCAVFGRMMENPLVENVMNRLALSRCSQIMEVLQQVLFSRVDKRLAACLLRMSEQANARELRLTHEQLARDISSAREVVSRALAKFAEEKLITMRRGMIRIENPEGLRKLL